MKLFQNKMTALRHVVVAATMEGKYHDLYPPNFTRTLYNRCLFRCISSKSRRA